VPGAVGPGETLQTTGPGQDALRGVADLVGHVRRDKDDDVRPSDPRLYEARVAGVAALEDAPETLDDSTVVPVKALPADDPNLLSGQRPAEGGVPPAGCSPLPNPGPDRPARPAGPGAGARLAGSGVRHPRFGDMTVLREGTDAFIRNTLGVEVGEVTDDLWNLVSPVAYARASVPPTLLLQGAHDCLVPVEATRELHRRLAEAGARVVYVEYPETEHGFDLGVLRAAPAAQNAMYHLDYFLALLA